MLLSTYEQDTKVYFRIDSIDPKYISVLQNCYYQVDDRGFHKVFPIDYPNIGIIRENFQKHGKTMFDQLGYFSDVPWERGLKAFIDRIKDTDIDWWLTGSCAACVRGIMLQPHDVDIMIDSKDVPAIMNIFADVFFEPLLNTQGWVTRDFGVLFMDCRIDIASDPAERLDIPEPVDCGPFAKAHLETVIWKGNKIRIPPIALSIAVNKKRNRWDRVKLMEGYVKSLELNGGFEPPTC